MSNITKARKLAEFAHNGQLYGSKEYTYHLSGVERIARSLAGADDIGIEDVVIVCWLHDIVEDTHITCDFLITSGFSERVVSSIRLLTKVDGEKHEEYINNIKNDKLALLVKKADTLFNLTESVKVDNRKRVKKYTEQLSELFA